VYSRLIHRVANKVLSRRLDSQALHGFEASCYLPHAAARSFGYLGRGDKVSMVSDDDEQR
jgi:hypothetical protein